MKKITFILIAILFASCSKDHSCEECIISGEVARQLPVKSARDQAIEKEKRDPLARNQLLEERALAFILMPTVDSTIASVWVKLYKGYDSTQTRLLPEVPIFKHNYNNYSVDINALEDSTEYTLTVEYDRAILGGKFAVTATGISNTDTLKYFTMAASLNATAAGTVRDCIRIQKGIIKYSFFTLQ